MHLWQFQHQQEMVNASEWKWLLSNTVLKKLLFLNIHVVYTSLPQPLCSWPRLIFSEVGSVLAEGGKRTWGQLAWFWHISLANIGMCASLMLSNGRHVHFKILQLLSLSLFSPCSLNIFFYLQSFLKILLSIFFLFMFTFSFRHCSLSYIPLLSLYFRFTDF